MLCAPLTSNEIVSILPKKAKLFSDLIRKCDLFVRSGCVMAHSIFRTSGHLL